LEDLALAFCGTSKFSGVIAAGVGIRVVGVCVVIRICVAVALGGVGVTAIARVVVAIIMVAVIPL